MKSISNFGSLVKSLNEENKNLKAPLKNYNDIDLSKENYRREPKERIYREKVVQSTPQDDLQRPTFSNTSLNEKKNFKELDTQGDVKNINFSCT